MSDLDTALLLTSQKLVMHMAIFLFPPTFTKYVWMYAAALQRAHQYDIIDHQDAHIVVVILAAF
ncbi:hypothetical protein BDR06DRAFT_761612 [Suillus hirtellus]|nr:hypothetical protein BDR06DRAFT_761612 [Suillus hirtellus]